MKTLGKIWNCVYMSTRKIWGFIQNAVEKYMNFRYRIKENICSPLELLKSLCKVCSGRLRENSLSNKVPKISKIKSVTVKIGYVLMLGIISYEIPAVRAFFKFMIFHKAHFSRYSEIRLSLYQQNCLI